MAAAGEPASASSGRGAPRAASSTATARSSSTTGSRSSRHPRPHRPRRARRRRARRRRSPRSPKLWPGRASRRRSRSSRPPRRQALQPVHAGAGRRGRPRGRCRSTSPSTPSDFAGRRGRARGRAPVPVRPAGRPRPRLRRRRSTTRSSRRRRARRSRTSSATRSGRPASSAPTRTTCGARRATRSIEVDAEGRPIREVAERPRRWPATTSCSPSTSTCRPSGRAGAAPALEQRASDRSSSGCQSRPKRRPGAVVVLDPKTGGVVAMASYPTFDPADFVDGIGDAEWAALTGRGATTRRSSTGPSRASTRRARRSSSFTAYAGAAQPGSSRPTPPCHDDGELRRCPTARGDACAFRNAGGEAVRRRRPAAGAHRVERRLLLRPRRPVLDRAGPRRRARSRTPTALEQLGFGATPASPCPSEQAGRHPDAERGWREHGENPDGVPGRRQWRAGDNVNMAIGQGELLVTPLQLANAYATFANGGTLCTPQHRAARCATAAPRTLVRTIEPDGAAAQVEIAARVAASRCCDGFTGRRPTQRRRHRRRRLRRLPARHVPVAGKTGTAQVADRANKADTAVFVGLRPGHRRPVRRRRGARGGRLRRRGRGARRAPASSTSCATRCTQPPAPEGGTFDVLDTLAPHHRGRARLMAAPMTAAVSHRERVAPGALGRLSRNPAAPWRHLDLVLVGCVAAVAALGVADGLQRHPRAATRPTSTPASSRSRCCSSASASALMVVVAVVDYRRFRDWRPVALRRRAASLLLAGASPARAASARAPGVVPARAVPAAAVASSPSSR